MRRQAHGALLFSCLLALPSCADSLAKRLADESDASDEHEESASPGTAAPGEVVETELDASSQSESVYFDLDTGSKVSADEGWDLSFKRFHIRLNGGVSGSRGVQALVLESQDFDALEEAPSEGFSSDEPDGDADNDSDPDNVFCNGERDWYEYEVSDHTLTSRKLTYVIASDEQKLYKLVLDGYYDAAGSPAQISFRWARLQGPAPEPSQPDDAGEQDLPDAVTGASSADAGEHDTSQADGGQPDATQPDASQPDASRARPAQR